MQGPEERAESNAGLEATKKRGEGTMDRLKVVGQGEPLGPRRKNLNEQHLQNRQFRETARGCLRLPEAWESGSRTHT